MHLGQMPRRFLIGGAIPATLFLLRTGAQAAPPHVREARPQAQEILNGRHIEFFIRFDAPVDHAAARMAIMQDGRLVRALAPLLDSAPDVLFAGTEAPPPGKYVLRWEARAPTGEAASGEIPFSVAP
jgi:hypothetical protein